MIGSAVVATTCQACDQRPDGRRTPIAASGTKTPSSVTSLEPVARIPSVRQLSWTLTPGGGQDQLVGGESAQETVDRGTLATPPPGRDQDLVRVHRQRQGGGRARMGPRAEDLAHLGERGAAAAELGEHRRREYPPSVQIGEVVGYERVVGVVLRRPGGECRRELLGDRDPVDPGSLVNRDGS